MQLSICVGTLDFWTVDRFILGSYSPFFLSYSTIPSLFPSKQAIDEQNKNVTKQLRCRKFLNINMLRDNEIRVVVNPSQILHYGKVFGSAPSTSVMPANSTESLKSATTVTGRLRKKTRLGRPSHQTSAHNHGRKKPMIRESGTPPSTPPCPPHIHILTNNISRWQNAKPSQKHRAPGQDRSPPESPSPLSSPSQAPTRREQA